MPSILLLIAVLVALALPGTVAAQDRPRAGRELVLGVPAELPSSDAQRESTIRSWTITPSHDLNEQRDTVWLAE